MTWRDRLQQMRDASKTGGALGAINKTEMDLLQSVLGNLEQSLDADDLAFNLRRINEVYLDIVHGKGNRPEAAGQPSPSSSESVLPTTFDEFSRNPAIQRAAKQAGVTVERMWKFQQGQSQ